MIFAKISSKNQLTLPKDIVRSLGLRRGDLLSVRRLDNKIILVPQSFEDKYPEDLLERLEKKLSKGLLPKEKKFSSKRDLLEDLDK
ncbi:MAG: AbrB/MazE/SpoVT family DNA-binding domain-containing protein [Chlamydiae bacterium]|nr:AbrB/MazE/SpoVT family DNA-binding domain-containing protein [Chlamydiota bacterium]MBI3276539.1 AbrB/MazE/SpoVT family DNA-binding domain-containing protein [Chlamydiota bacterium]